EFTTRVRNRSFLVLTLVVPILLAGFFSFLMWMLLKDDTQDRKIAEINQSVLETPIEQINNNTIEYLNTPVDE
ncbi:ABC transporter permease, partial [Odoribacter splanchnicus]|nr:ABC transporter permease [Odoribacter splanchnicus]